MKEEYTGLFEKVAPRMSDEELLGAVLSGGKEHSMDNNKNTSKKRRIKAPMIAVIAAAVTACVVIGVAVLAYALTPVILHGVLNSTQTVIYVIVFIIAALVAAGFVAYNMVKTHIPDKVNKILLLVARIAVGCIAVSFIIAGAVNGGADIVLTKAINICTECIGLG